jgi:alkaline phosphatase D
VTGADLDGRDRSARDDDDHAELLSELDSHDLALGLDLVESSDGAALEFDAVADRDVVVAYRVPEGVVNLAGVTDEYRG